MSLSNISWNGKGPNFNASAPIAGQQVTINVPTVATSGAATPHGFTFQMTIGGSTITPPKSQAQIAKENADAFDRAMGIVG
jgi:hypothetical protein